MAPETSPAFSFYPKDWLAATLTWALDARGAYVTLMAYQWDAGSVPGDDLPALARLLGVNVIKARLVWAVISDKFDRQPDGTWKNARLEKERQKQAAYRELQSLKGQASARNRASTGVQPSHQPSHPTSHQPDGQPKPNSSFSSSSSSSESPKEQGFDAPRPLISGESNPKTWGKIHGDHVPGFCDWVCLPEFIFAEFARKSAGAEYVRQWARNVRDAWQDRDIGDNLKFWRARWSEAHPEAAPSKPKVEPFSVAAALEREQARKAGAK